MLDITIIKNHTCTYSVIVQFMVGAENRCIIWTAVKHIQSWEHMYCRSSIIQHVITHITVLSQRTCLIHAIIDNRMVITILLSNHRAFICHKSYPPSLYTIGKHSTINILPPVVHAPQFCCWCVRKRIDCAQCAMRRCYRYPFPYIVICTGRGGGERRFPRVFPREMR